MNLFFYITPIILQTIIWPFSRPLFRFFLHLEILGFENVEKLSPGVIFASNHQGDLDAILVPTSLPFLSRFSPIHYVSREEKFYHWTPGWRRYIYGGLFFKLLGSHPARMGERNYAVALETHVEILKHKKSLLIFPQGGVTDEEGKMTMRGEPVTVKGGSGYLSHATNLPVVPIYLEGCHRVSAREFWSRKRHVKVIFGKPLYAQDLFSNQANITPEDYKAAAQKIVTTIYMLSSSYKDDISVPYSAPAVKHSKVSRV